jgi:hypothetical protein
MSEKNGKPRKGPPLNPVMRKPKHGHGMLLSGSNHGNVSSTGRKDPGVEIRELFRGILTEGLEEATARITAMKDERISRIYFENLTRDELIEYICGRIWLSWKELQELIDVTAKYGIGTQQELLDKRDPIAVGVLQGPGSVPLAQIVGDVEDVEE